MFGIDQYTRLLLHCDGVDDSVVFRDEVSNSPVVVAGNTHIHTGEKKLGSASAAFDGTGDYLAVGGVALGLGDFTIDLWAFLTNAASYRFLFDCRVAAAAPSAFGLCTDVNRKVRLITPDAFRITTDTAISLDTQTHIALERYGTLYTIYIAGTADAQTATLTETYLGGRFIIGAAGDALNNLWIGYMDEIRISNVARYMGNFTPPTEPYKKDIRYLGPNRNRFRTTGVSLG